MVDHSVDWNILHLFTIHSECCYNCMHIRIWIIEHSNIVCDASCYAMYSQKYIKCESDATSMLQFEYAESAPGVHLTFYL